MAVGGTRVAARQGGMVAECDVGSPLPVPPNEARANARLIAAAPETAAERDRLRAEVAELREALAGLLAGWKVGSGNPDRVKQARAALAKGA